MNEKDILDLFEEESDDLTVIEEGDWTQEYKYQYSKTIVYHAPTSAYWAIEQSRSGSYHTDWYYDEPTAHEVVRVEKRTVVHSWVEV